MSSPSPSERPPQPNRSRLLAFLQARLGIDPRYPLRTAPFLLIAEIVTAVGRLGLSALLARILTNEGFGQYSYSMAVMGLFAIISMPGLDTAATQAVARGFEGTYGICTRARFRWAILGALGLLVPAGWSLARGQTERAALLLIVAVFFIPYNAGNAASGFFKGKRDFRRGATVDVVVLVSTVSLSTVLALLARTPLGAVLGFVAGASVANIWFTLQLLRQTKGAGVDQSALRYGKHLTLIAVIPWLATYLDRILIEQFLTFEHVGLFSIAVNLPDQARRLGGIIYGVAFPKVAALPPEVAYKKVMRLLPALALLFVAMAGVGALIMPVAIRLLYGARYVEAIPYAQFSCLYFAVASVAAAFLDLLFPAQKSTSSLVVMNLLNGAVKLASMTVGVILWGFWGVVASPLVAALASGIAGYFLARRNFRRGIAMADRAHG